MRALWLEDRRLTVRDVAEPEPQIGEARVRVLLAGICNTDIELTRGYYPFTGIPGHEFVGQLDDGRRVAGEINASCGTCEPCLHGRRTHCDRRSVLGIIGRNGAFAEYLTLPSANLHEIPRELSNEQAVFTEPVAAALQIQQQLSITPETRVLVVGEGKLGTLIARTLALTGCRLTVIGRGAEVAARSFDVVVECSGNPEGFETARKAVRARGTIVMKSTYAGDLTFNASALVVDEITLVGSRCGPFDLALKVLPQIDTTDLIDAVYPLELGVQAFEHAQRPRTLKVLIRP